MTNLDALLNPRGQIIKKWMQDLLKDRYSKHEIILERVGHVLVTNQDIQDFGKLAVDLYEIGYLQCMNDYKDKLSQLGVQVISKT